VPLYPILPIRSYTLIYPPAATYFLNMRFYVTIVALLLSTVMASPIRIEQQERVARAEAFVDARDGCDGDVGCIVDHDHRQRPGFF